MTIRMRMLMLVLINGLMFIFIAVSTSVLFISYKKAVSVADGDLQVMHAALDLERGVNKLRREEKNFLLFKKTVYLESVKKTIKETDEHLMNLRKLAEKEPNFTGPVNDIYENFEKYKSLVAGLPAVSDKRLLQFTAEARGTTENIVEGLTSMEMTISDRMLEAMYQRRRVLGFYTFLVLGGVGAATILCFSWGLWFWSNVNRRLNRLAAAARHIMLGEYQPVVDAGPMDEVGKLSLAFDEMRQKIAEREEHIEKLNTDLVKLTNQLKRG